MTGRRIPITASPPITSAHALPINFTSRIKTTPSIQGKKMIIAAPTIQGGKTIVAATIMTTGKTIDTTAVPGLTGTAHGSHHGIVTDIPILSGEAAITGMAITIIGEATPIRLIDTVS
jgi:uncharacterized protein (DUF433 family)